LQFWEVSSQRIRDLLAGNLAGADDEAIAARVWREDCRDVGGGYFL
jgi:hypothetical protein